MVIIVLLLKAGDFFGFEFERTEALYTDGEPSEKLHALTLVFQTYAFLQLFNLINARSIDSCNVFSSLHRDCFFILYWVAVLGLQLVLVSFGGRFFGAYPLAIEESGVCLVIAAASLLWSTLFKVLPERWFSCLVRSPEEGGPKAE